jgi:prepilin-type N-terminal cleavage/methylation domain-containing protein
MNNALFSRVSRRRMMQQGFSLLETLVAFFILAMVLSVIYESAGSSVDVTISDERRSYALLLAESVLSNYQSIPAGGLTKTGRLENGYAWFFIAIPRSAPKDTNYSWPLYDVRVRVEWGEPSRVEEIDTVLPQSLAVQS